MEWDTPHRRLRRRERRALRRIERLAPICVVVLAMGLSAGVVKVMEVPRAELEPAPAPVVEPPAREAALLAPDASPELRDALSVGLLDDAVLGPPEPSHLEEPVAEEPPALDAERSAAADPLLHDVEQLDLEVESRARRNRRLSRR